MGVTAGEIVKTGDNVSSDVTAYTVQDSDGLEGEWSYNREIARRVVAALQSEHFYASQV